MTDDTEIECGEAARASHDDPDGAGDDAEGDRDDDEGDDDCGDRSEGRSSDDEGDHHDDDDDECGADALTVGAAVEAAELQISSDGRIWKEIELR